MRKLEKVDRLEMWDGTFGEGWELEVEAQEALGQASLGCSIAVNGVCLTVTEFDDASFKVGLAPETLRRSNLADLSEGSPVNLERALPADGRNSGHFVQGHVDDVGVIKELRPDGDSLYVTVQPPARLMPYIVPKGFIAIDGTSLTVCDVDQAAGTQLPQSAAPPLPLPPAPSPPPAPLCYHRPHAAPSLALTAHALFRSLSGSLSRSAASFRHLQLHAHRLHAVQSHYPKEGRRRDGQPRGGRHLEIRRAEPRCGRRARRHAGG